MPPSSQPSTQTGAKRKAPENDYTSSQPSASQIPATQMPSEEDLFGDDNLDEVAADELYVTLPTNVVGIQYYTGEHLSLVIHLEYSLSFL
jgi:hypothetical protein